MRIIVRRDAEVNSGRRLIQREWVYASIFKRFPACLQKQPLLRIDPDRLTWRDTEVLRIEAVYFVQKAGPSRGLRQRHLTADGSQPALHPIADSDPFFLQQLPEAFISLTAAWNTASDAYDGDRLRAFPFKLIRAGLRRLQSEKGLLQWR